MLKRMAIFLLLVSIARGNLESLKTEIVGHTTYKDLTNQQWDVKSTYRGLHKRSQKDFDWLEGMYPRKIEHARLMITTVRDVEELAYWINKEARMLDKLACVIAEQRLRKDGLVTRIGTHDAADYYIDYGSGSDASDGLTIGNAYKTITKYTTTEVRVPGDRAFLRANIVWLQGTEAVDIDFDEDGSIDLLIELIGADSVTNDPWSDSSDVLPIIDFEDGAYQMHPSSDDYWKITRLDLRQSGDANGAIYVQTIYVGNGFEVVDCVIRDGLSTSVEGIHVTSGAKVLIDNCTLQDCGGASVFANGGIITIKNSTIDAGAGIGSDRGIYCIAGARATVEDTTIAGSNAFSAQSMRCLQSSIIIMRNVTFGTENNVVDLGGVILSEDHDGTFESQIQTYIKGIISRGTTSPRAGGADSFAILTPNSTCGPNNPLRLGYSLAGFARVWKAAGSYTATVYARVDSAWDSALTAAECYMVTSELDNAGNATRVERTSTETINNATTWTAFTTSVTPAREGWIYFWFYLAEFEDASEAVDVDIKVDAS